MEDELVHRLAFAKAHLGLGRMHVDVHAMRIELEEQHVGRMALLVQDVRIGLAHGVRQYLVAHEAAVDEEILGVAAGARVGGQGGVAAEAQAAGGGLDGARLGGEFLAEEVA